MYIYVIGPEEGNQKIGYSKNPERCLKSIQTGNPNKLKIHHKVEVPENRVRLLERQIHREIGHHRLAGEWFSITSSQAIDEVKYAVMRWLDDPLLGR